jgi:cell division protein FtsN
VLGLALIIGMSIGRGQGERAARIANEEVQSQKLGLAPEAPKLPAESAEKLVIAQGPNPTKMALSDKLQVAQVAPAKGEIELREDPLIQGPPKKRAKAAKRANTEVADDEAPVKKPRKKKALAKAEKSDEVEVSGRVEHAKKRTKRSDDEETVVEHKGGSARYTIQVAAFKRSGDAATLIGKLKGEGIKAHSEKHGDFYLVTVGRTKSKEKLSKALSRLKELEYDAYIRKLRQPSSET